MKNAFYEFCLLTTISKLHKFKGKMCVQTFPHQAGAYPEALLGRGGGIFMSPSEFQTF